MRFIFKVLFGMLKIAAVLAAVTALAGVVFSLTKDSDQRRYLVDMELSGEDME